MSKLDRALVFAALGDPVRLELLARISDGGSITKLTADLPITRQAVTRHLRILERAELIVSQRNGREMRFVARPARLIEAKGWLDDVAQQWDGTLGRLKLLVERKKT
ncbi:MAG: metalloregulator ArsR/SmtB family transcription factor [Parvularculaceae bacterium]